MVNPVNRKMADLPMDKLSPGSPFVFCGTDLFGHFFIKSGRLQLKRYGVIFTCLEIIIYLQRPKTYGPRFFIKCVRYIISCVRYGVIYACYCYTG